MATAGPEIVATLPFKLGLTCLAIKEVTKDKVLGSKPFETSTKIALSLIFFATKETIFFITLLGTAKNIISALFKASVILKQALILEDNFIPGKYFLFSWNFSICFKGSISPSQFHKFTL